jgi:hypothetical protein
MQMLLESSIFCSQQVKNRQHSGKQQLREVTASLGPFSAAAETAAATARPVAARWKHKYKQTRSGTTADGSRRRRETRDPRPYGQGLRFLAQQQRAPGSQGKRDKYSQETFKNRFRTCRFAVF